MRGLALNTVSIVCESVCVQVRVGVSERSGVRG
jgi:hypothetical protein